MQTETKKELLPDPPQENTQTTPTKNQELNALTLAITLDKGHIDHIKELEELADNLYDMEQERPLLLSFFSVYDFLKDFFEITLGGTKDQLRRVKTKTGVATQMRYYLTKSQEELEVENNTNPKPQWVAIDYKNAVNFKMHHVEPHFKCHYQLVQHALQHLASSEPVEHPCPPKKPFIKKKPHEPGKNKPGKPIESPKPTIVRKVSLKPKNKAATASILKGVESLTPDQKNQLRERVEGRRMAKMEISQPWIEATIKEIKRVA